MYLYLSKIFLIFYLFTKVTDGDITHGGPARESLTSKLKEPVLNTESTKDNPISSSEIGPGLVDTTKSTDQQEKTTSKAKNTFNAKTIFDMNDFKVTTLKDSNFEEAEENDENEENEDAENCLAKYSPEKVEAVRKTLKNDGGRVKYVFANPPPVTEEEIKISACLKKIWLKTKSQGHKGKVTVQPDTPKNTSDSRNGSKKRTENEKLNVTAGKNETDDQRRLLNDNDYQFESLQYVEYDTGFDDNTCPELMNIVYLEIGEVKQYDLECERITVWTSLADAYAYVGA